MAREVLHQNSVSLNIYQRLCVTTLVRYPPLTIETKMQYLIQKLSCVLTAIAVITLPISAFAGNSRFLRILAKHNPQLGYTLLCIVAAFFLYSAATNWDWAFSSLVSRMTEKVIGRSGMRIVFTLIAVYCGQIGVNGFVPHTAEAPQQNWHCGEIGTNSFIDRDGECDCLNGYAWLDDSNPISFQCIPTADS